MPNAGRDRRVPSLAPPITADVATLLGSWGILSSACRREVARVSRMSGSAAQQQSTLPLVRLPARWQQSLPCRESTCSVYGSAPCRAQCGRDRVRAGASSYCTAPVRRWNDRSAKLRPQLAWQRRPAMAQRRSPATANEAGPGLRRLPLSASSTPSGRPQPRASQARRAPTTPARARCSLQPGS